MARNTTIIAEPGCTHEGDLGKLRALVQMAAECGCNGVKTQWMSDPELVCKRRNAPDYLPCYQWLKYPLRWHETLARECHDLGMEYGCTAYVPADVAKLDGFIDFYKIASFETGARDLIKAIAKAMNNNTKKLVVSLGMGADSKEIIDALGAAKALVDRLVLLRCVSAYPTPFDELHLATLWSSADGLSDHTPAGNTRSVMVGALATAAGARWIERHIRLEDCKSGNPDYPVSLSAHELRAYVHAVRFAEIALGSPKIAGAMPSEQPMMQHRATI